MNARLTIAAVAKILTDVNWLKSAEGFHDRREGSSPDLVSTLRTLDANRLRQFAGFITKIKHNYLWEDFPFTRRLVANYKLDTELFTEYCPVFQKSTRSATLSREQKSDLFVQFLLSFLDSRGRREIYPTIYDVVIHEHTLLELRNAICEEYVDNVPANGASQEVNEDAQLRPTGTIRSKIFEHSPLDVISTMQHGEMAGINAMPGEYALIYCKRANADSVNVYDADTFTTTILSIIVDTPGITRRWLRKVLHEISTGPSQHNDKMLDRCVDNLLTLSLVRALHSEAHDLEASKK